MNMKSLVAGFGLFIASMGFAGKAAAQQTKPTPPTNVKTEKVYESKKQETKKDAKGRTITVTTEESVHKGQRSDKTMPPVNVRSNAPTPLAQQPVQTKKVFGGYKQTNGPKMENTKWQKFLNDYRKKHGHSWIKDNPQIRIVKEVPVQAAPIVQATPVQQPQQPVLPIETNNSAVFIDTVRITESRVDTLKIPVKTEKEKRPMKIRLNYGQTTVISPDGSDLYSGKAFKFMEFGVTSPVFGDKGTVGEWFSIDADIKVGKAPKAEVTADNPGCGCPNALVINGGDNNKLAYRGELSLLVGKDFNFGKKEQFTFGAHVAMGGVIRSKPVITDKPGLAFKKALPEVIDAPETFGGFAELRTRAQWNINKNLAVFVEGNYGAQTFKTNTESVYRPNAKVNNPLAEERPYGNGALDKAKTFITGKGGLVWTLGR